MTKKKLRRNKLAVIMDKKLVSVLNEFLSLRLLRTVKKVEDFAQICSRLCGGSLSTHVPSSHILSKT